MRKRKSSTKSKKASENIKGLSVKTPSIEAKNASEEVKRAVLRKMIGARSKILARYPFYGYLVMHLQLGLSDCGTACTDMKHLLFDPEFAQRLSEEEMIFVMLHEVLHCSLDHCQRSRNYQPQLFNIAADIVVNSNILYSMGIAEFQVDGEPAMHIAPDGREGYHFSAEEVYQMLLREIKEEGSGSSSREQSSGRQSRKSPGAGGDDLLGDGSADGQDESYDDSGQGIFGKVIDSHDIWVSVDEMEAVSDTWKKLNIEGGKKYSSQDVPMSVRDYIRELNQKAKVDWRTVLQDFIQLFHDRYDYSFAPSDRRYTWSDFIMPAYTEAEEDEHVENLWFCVDTSGSMGDRVLSEIMNEIKQAILLFDHLSGKLSFFDTHVTEPVPFDTEEDILNMTMMGGGGTSYAVIFNYLKEFPEDERPSAIIILTDGWCNYPEEEASQDIPVLWIIYDNDQDPPWGSFVHM